jgi:hypothetical protein
MTLVVFVLPFIPGTVRQAVTSFSMAFAVFELAFIFGAVGKNVGSPTVSAITFYTSYRNRYIFDFFNHGQSCCDS